jgi:hypothetical protein
MKNKYGLDYQYYTIRPAAILTTSYVVYPIALIEANQPANQPAMTIQSLLQCDQIIFYAFLTLGSLTSINLKVEFSPDNVNWVQETYDSVNGTTGIVSELPMVRNILQSCRIPIRIRDAYMRISAEGVGTVTGSSLTLGAMIGTDV